MGSIFFWNVILSSSFHMIKFFAGALALSLTGTAAMADGFYVNPEYNAGFTGSDFGGGVLDGHVGYESGGWYIQGGPSVLMPDGGEATTGFSAKTGVGADVTENLGIYGEVSVAKYEDADAGYGLKVGAKYKF